MASNMMSSFDQDGKFYANVISRSGRNEIQIFNVQDSLKNGQESLSERPQFSVVQKFSLEAGESIIGICWGTEDNETKNGTPKKKRSANGSVATSDSNSNANLKLIVALESGDVLIYSPYVSDLISRIETEESNIAISGFEKLLKKSTFWVAKQGNFLVEYSLSNTKPLKSIKLGKKPNVIASVPNLTNNSQQLLVSYSNTLVLLDVSKSTPKTLVTYSVTSNKPIIQLNYCDEGKIVAVLRKNSNTVELYNLKDQEVVGSVQTSSIISQTKFFGSVLMAFTKEGIQTFNIDFDFLSSNVEPSCLITTNNEDHIIEDAAYINNQQLVCVWYNLNEPRFDEVDWKFESAGEILLQIENYTSELEVSDEDLATREIIINNLDVETLVSLLNKNLQGSIDNDKKASIVKLASENNNEPNIKTVIQDLSDDKVGRLFEIFSEEVASRPTRTQNISIWLKWLLLVHGGSLVNQHENIEKLKNLQESLSSKMKLLPKLLALKGRLSMLKLQQQLRDSNESEEEDVNEEEEEVEEDNEQGKDGDVNEVSAVVEEPEEEESILYANGENDDDATPADVQEEE